MTTEVLLRVARGNVDAVIVDSTTVSARVMSGLFRASTKDASCGRSSMPPKRSAEPLLSPSPSKKAKTSQGQSKLDNFFKSPSRASRGKEKEVVVIHDSDDEDAQLAARLAAEEGMDLELARKLENEWSAKAAISADTANKAPSATEPPLRHDPTETVPTSRAGVKASLQSGKLGRGTELVVASKQAPEFSDLSVDPIVAFNITSCPWPSADDVNAPYSFLAHALSMLSATRSRILILNILTNTLRALIVYHPASLLPALYLLSNTFSPPYSPIELGLGSSVITKALQHVSGLSSTALRKLYNETGDAGDVAFAAKSSLRTLVAHKPLTILGVYRTLMQIAHSKGQGSVKLKQSLVEKLLVSANGEETRFLVRTLVQNLRVGAVRTTMLSALARAMVLNRPSAECLPQSQSDQLFADEILLRLVKPLEDKKRKAANQDEARDSIVSLFAKADSLIRRVYVQHPNYEHIVQALLQHPFELLPEQVRLSIGSQLFRAGILAEVYTGIPLHPTLGSPTRSLEEIFERLGDSPFSAEFKYDGQRAQIHAQRQSGGDNLVKIFSRHLEDMTDKVLLILFWILVADM